MKRWRFSKSMILLWLVVFLAFSGDYLHRFYSRQSMIAAAGERGNLEMFAIPRLQRYGKTSTPLSDGLLWNLSPQEKSEQDTAGPQESKSPYGLKTFGDVQAIYSLKDPMVRWEFYGIFQKNGETRAIFHNPSSENNGWIVPGVAEDLIPGLRLAEISDNHVVLVETQAEVGKAWQLTLFAEVTPVNRTVRSNGRE